ncbi:hypothetical protein IFM89_028061 [Coptis chinensis]|uniref:Acid phosphatase n=1 Tax=Coptis chinensis TaxID=261450 RepID=A0A835HFQ1_9MAGN|nr:hypothetical protein IFM89_028061 [Coptis chinensis]
MSDSSVGSSFTDQMERRNSTQVLSGGSSGFGSHYQMESGLFVTSFAASLFIVSLVTIAVLFITLLTTLIVMLQSCENRNNGVLQLPRRSDQYDYCRTLSVQAEVNRFEVDEIPSICKAHAVQYIKDGQYLRDLNWTMCLVNSYFNNSKPEADGLDVVLMDIDDILALSHPYHTFEYQINLYEMMDQFEVEKIQAGAYFLELYTKLQARGWSLILISRKPEKLRNATLEALVYSGYGGWSSLIMRPDDETLDESWKYLSRRRAELQDFGYRITSVISSNMAALTGPCLGKRVFKLPSPLLYKLEHHVNSF